MFVCWCFLSFLVQQNCNACYIPFVYYGINASIHISMRLHCPYLKCYSSNCSISCLKTVSSFHKVVVHTNRRISYQFKNHKLATGNLQLTDMWMVCMNKMLFQLWSLVVYIDVNNRKPDCFFKKVPPKTLSGSH